MKARVERKRQRPGEDPDVFARRPPDRVVTVEVPKVVTNPDDMKSESVSYIGIRKPNDQARVPTGAERKEVT